MVDLSQPAPEPAPPPAAAGGGALTVAGMQGNIPQEDINAFAGYVGRNMGWDDRDPQSRTDRAKPCVYDARHVLWPDLFPPCRGGARCARLHMKGPSRPMDQVSALTNTSAGGAAGWRPGITPDEMTGARNAMRLTAAAVQAHG